MELILLNFSGGYEKFHQWCRRGFFSLLVDESVIKAKNDPLFPLISPYHLILRISKILNILTGRQKGKGLFRTRVVSAGGIQFIASTSDWKNLAEIKREIIGAEINLGELVGEG